MLRIFPLARISFAVSLGVATALSACAAQTASLETTSIVPPEGEKVMTLEASGVQVYSCEFDSQHRLQWVFKSPSATLYDDHGTARVIHSAGPSWQEEDGSRIVGRVLAQKPSEAKDSIPQLLLEVHSTGQNGTLTPIRYVQRINTVGGKMPGAACSSEHEAGSVPYLAEYVFYR